MLAWLFCYIFFVDQVIVLINTISVVGQQLQCKGCYLCWGDHGSVEYLLDFPICR